MSSIHLFTLIAVMAENLESTRIFIPFQPKIELPSYGCNFPVLVPTSIYMVDAQEFYDGFAATRTLTIRSSSAVVSQCFYFQLAAILLCRSMFDFEVPG